MKDLSWKVDDLINGFDLDFDVYYLLYKFPLLTNRLNRVLSQVHASLDNSELFHDLSVIVNCALMKQLIINRLYMSIDLKIRSSMTRKPCILSVL
jgi:hypothetical protein